MYRSDRDGFLREFVFVGLFVSRPVLLPRTEDARFWREDHGDSRKSVVVGAGLEEPFNPNDESSLRLRFADSVTREGCFIGRGDTPRDERGEGVAPRERGPSDRRVVERPDANG